MKTQIPTKVFGASLILAPIFNLAAAALSGTGSIAASATLATVALALTIPAFVAIALLVYRFNGSLAVVAGFLAAFGIVSSVVWTVMEFAVPTAEESLLAPLYPMGLAFPLAVLTFAAGLWQTDGVSGWVSAVLAAAGVMFVVTWFVNSAVPGLIYAVLLLVALGWLGAKFWRGAASITEMPISASA